ncbi:hypothetical protein Y032_0189g1183 [Ancylostoma ceylanicum]|uniref:Uncharacterized protein n=1 Tax=Ancylostoma ceylanicum TaxID=53326 RepID=A0A016SR12_9BILA|nr:hypothetical protein Y032_0189g1183 [Ancylostoma ceylanicum]
MHVLRGNGDTDELCDWSSGWIDQLQSSPDLSILGQFVLDACVYMMNDRLSRSPDAARTQARRTRLRRRGGCAAFCFRVWMPR